MTVPVHRKPDPANGAVGYCVGNFSNVYRARKWIEHQPNPERYEMGAPSGDSYTSTVPAAEADTLPNFLPRGGSR